MKKFITNILLLICFSITYSQYKSYNFKHLTVHEGLSQNWIRCIFQDSYGYIWFGTDNGGINKFDGYEFKIFKYDLNLKYCLTSNTINIIIEDSKHTLWIGTQQGINTYDREKDIFKPYPILKNNYIIGLYELKNGKIIVVSEDIVYLIDPKNKTNRTICQIINNQCIEGDFLTSIAEDKFGNLWVGSAVGLQIIDTTTNKLIHFRLDKENTNFLHDEIITCLYKDNKGDIWAGTRYNGVYLIQGNIKDNFSPKIIHLKNNPDHENTLSGGEIRAIFNDLEGNIWIGAENGGINILKHENYIKNIFVFEHYVHNPYDNLSISSNSIYKIYGDNQGTVWIGTFNCGISYYNKLLFKFGHVRPSPDKKNSINDNFINTFFEDRDNIWIGTEKGITVFNRKTNAYKFFINDPNNKSSIGSNAIWSIYKDSKENIWVGTWAGGLNLYNKKTETFTRFLHNDTISTSIGSDNIFGIAEDVDGYLWIACMNGGLNKFNPQTKKFEVYLQDKTKDRLSSNWVRTVIKSSYNEIWISTTNSVQIYNKERDEFITFKNNPSDKSSIGYNGAEVLFEDSKKNFWIGTQAGLHLYNRRSKSFISYRIEDGLPNNSIKGICEDDHGNLWLSTNKGISKFIKGIIHPENPKFINYDLSDGLQGEEFTNRSFYKDKQGWLYFRGNNGYNFFHPYSITNNEIVPLVVITDFYLFNKSVEIGSKNSPLKKHIGLTKELILSHKHNVIGFKFTALNYLNPEKNQYSYILEGFDKKWNFVGNKHEATYTNLNPGKYTFKVIACNNDNKWNKIGVSIKIIILPPWWKTLFFRITFLLIIIGSSVGYYFLRISQLKNQKIQLEKIVKKRTYEIEEKNNLLLQQTKQLSEANTILEERQQQIEEQSEELKAQKDELEEVNEYLNETNTSLEEKQQQIEEQAEILKYQKKELEEMNLHLNTLNTTKDRFFSIIAHDLKNPIHVVMGFAELLNFKFKTLTEEKKIKFSKIIYASVKNIYDLLENLLQWARSQTNKIIFEPEVIDLNSIVDQNYLLIKNNLEKKRIRFTNNISTNSNVFADKNMLNTIFRNLLTNAAKFTPDKGKITLKSKIKNDNVTISITDTGTGMTNEEIEKLFKVDSNFSKKGTGGETGTGLGLIICKEYIEKNNGKIWVETEPGKGSTFFFSLPIDKI